MAAIGDMEFEHLTLHQLPSLSCQHLTTNHNNNKQRLAWCTSTHSDRDLDTGQLNADWFNLG